MIYYKGIEYSIPNWIMERFKKDKIDITENYINIILEKSGYKAEELDGKLLLRLLKQDIWNREFKSVFGDVVQYNKDGKKQYIFSDLYKIFMQKNALDFVYGFENFDKIGEIPTKRGVCFFEVKFLPLLYDQMSNKNLPLNLLNSFIRGNFNWLNGKHFINLYNELVSTNDFMLTETLEEYRVRKAKQVAFAFANGLGYGLKYNAKQKRNELDKNDYFKKIYDLQQRYSKDTVSFLEEVTNLNDYTNVQGVYILCLDDVFGYYVGQTNNCIKTRIKRHFQQMGSDFDREYGQNDVERIYVIQCPKECLDLIEQDCIAFLSKKYCLNSMVGGRVFDWISREGYQEKYYLLSTKRLLKILNKLKDYRNE